MRSPVVLSNRERNIARQSPRKGVLVIKVRQITYCYEAMFARMVCEGTYATAKVEPEAASKCLVVVS